MKRFMILTICIILCFSLFGCGSNTTYSSSNTSNYESEPIISTVSIPSTEVVTVPSTPEILPNSIGCLEIQDGWKWEGESDYSYIRGRVKNISTYNVGYYKLTAEFLDDNGNVLNTDYTNSNDTIRPNNMQEFEIMHKYSEEYKKVRIFIEEVVSK